MRYRNWVVPSLRDKNWFLPIPVGNDRCSLGRGLPLRNCYPSFATTYAKASVVKESFLLHFVSADTSAAEGSRCAQEKSLYSKASRANFLSHLTSYCLSQCCGPQRVYLSLLRCLTSPLPIAIGTSPEGEGFSIAERWWLFECR